MQARVSEIREPLQSLEIAARAQATTAEFHSLQVTQRPTFLIEDTIGDRAFFSGLVRIEPLSAAIENMLAGSLCLREGALWRPAKPMMPNATLNRPPRQVLLNTPLALFPAWSQIQSSYGP
jgi:hypothetical protein